MMQGVYPVCVCREVEVVMTQLENNTSELGELRASISARHDSALELTQRALKVG